LATVSFASSFTMPPIEVLGSVVFTNEGITMPAGEVFVTAPPPWAAHLRAVPCAPL
jgi:hypothetical protein